MKKFIFVFLTFNSLCFASEFLAYNITRETLSRQARDIPLTIGSDVFTDQEKQFLRNTPVETEIFKFYTDEKYFPELARIATRLNGHIEINARIDVQSIPNDEFFHYQWGLRNTGEDQIEWISDIDQRIITGVIGEDVNALEDMNEREVKVAVLDSGVDINHFDLNTQIFRSLSECQAQTAYKNCLRNQANQNICHQQWANMDTDNNGYPLDCQGWSMAGADIPQATVQGHYQVQDFVGHGTHVAGIIAARRDRIGITGAATNAKILPVQISGSSLTPPAERGSPTDIIAKGLLYAIKSQAEVVNLSLGWSLADDSLLMRQMVEMAIQRNMIIVAAGGNLKHYGPTFPCSYDHVICVGSHEVDGTPSAFSNYGTSIDLFAPGSRILSTYPTTKRAKRFTEAGGYEIMSGTSQAAPHVTALVAKLLGRGLSPNDVRIKILKGTRESREAKLARFGNADFQKSLETQTSCFIYPLNKTPALIQWNKEQKSTKLRLINYGEECHNITLALGEAYDQFNENLELKTKNYHFEHWPSSEIKEITLEFTNQDTHDIDSDLFLEIDINSDDFSKKYQFFMKAITVTSDIHLPNGANLVSYSGQLEITGANFAAFDEITVSTSNDFLAYKVSSNFSEFQLIKKSGDGYQIGRKLRLPLREAIFIKLSKLDLNFDGKKEYVITVLDTISQGKHHTRFLILDENFMPLRDYFILPENTFDNTLTVLPVSFIWAKINNRMTPVWVGHGKRPEAQHPTPGPWPNNFRDIRKFNLYYLTPEGLRADPFYFQENKQAISLLFQGEKDKEEGRFHVITGEGRGFYQAYYIDRYENLQRRRIQRLNLSPYASLVGIRGQENWETNLANSYFMLTGQERSKRVVTIKEEQSDHFVANQFVINPSDALNPIEYVLGVNERFAFFQDHYQLGLFGRSDQSVQYIDSKISTNNARFKRLNFNSAVYLAAEYTPGLSSELITAKVNNQGKLAPYRSARYGILPVQGCIEMNLVSSQYKDHIYFICPERSKIIQYQVEL